MPKKSRTSYFTQRGKYFGNLWVVFSLKANKILRLGSDRQLAHWLLNLEYSPAIKTFNFEPGTKIVSAGGVDHRIDYHVEVIPFEGPAELHTLRVEGFSDNYEQNKQLTKKLNYHYVEFNDENWLPHAPKVFPLLRLSSFLSGGRNAYIPSGLVEAAQLHIKTYRHGSLKSYLSAVRLYDQNLGLLVFCRMVVESKISVSCENSIFELNAQWWLNEK
jgi:hypothetical protein